MNDIAKLLARCLTNYGERRGIDMRLLATEWHASLFAYTPQALNAAVTEHIRRSTYWPTIANLVEILKESMQPARYGNGYVEPEVCFARAGRSIEQEIEFRVSQCREWREAAKASQKATDKGKPV